MVTLLGCRGDGGFDCQHGRVITVYGVCQGVHLLQYGTQHDAVMDAEFVIHPKECRVDAVLTDPSIGAVGGLSVMLSAYPGDISSFRDPPY